MKITYIKPADKKPNDSPESHAELMRRSVEQPHGKGEPSITMTSNNRIIEEQCEDDIVKNPHKYSASDVLEHYRRTHNRRVN